MRSLPTLAVLVLPLATGLLAACSGAGETRTLEPVSLGEVSPLHAFGDVYLAGQPNAPELAQLRDRGVRTVIDLRLAREDRGYDEAGVAAELGLAYHALPWAGPDQLTDEVLDQGRALLSGAEGPVLLHCASSNRVGAIWIAWRVLDDGASLEEATAEARTAGLRTEAYAERARAYVEARR